jgi:tRNA/tmRNA/rRNA uracil-C5-methylase (TrmA/RlmC/RlmD family)
MTLTPKLFRRQVVDGARHGATATPRCPHAPPADFCGGCVFQDRTYAAQLDAKRAALRALWEYDLPSALLDTITMVGSPDPFAYRTRMDYIASRDRFGLRRGGKFNYIVDLRECHLIPPAAFAIARGVYELATALGLPDYNLRSHEGFLRYVVVRRSPQEQLLLAIVTAAPDPAGEQAAAVGQVAAHALAQPGVVGFHWLINDSITDMSFGAPHRHWGAELLDMQVGARTLAIGPNTFFQNNVHLLLPLLDDVRAAALGLGAGSCDIGEQLQPATPMPELPSPAVADLYGGVGTIALHLADQVGRITCVESFAESARLAERNVAASGVANVDVVAADVLAFLRDQAPGAFEVVVADPPRAGLGPDVCRELLRLRPRRLVYVSCNALTQLADARALSPGYRLVELRGYDMFPQTPHLEALGVFEAIGR